MRRYGRLVDPTLLDHGGSFYLFANDIAEGDFVLRLWSSDDIEGTFQEHPASPVLISPCGGRMGGLLIDQSGLYRVGQDNSGKYGDGVLLFRVEELSRDTYRETLVDRLRFSEVHGPHTLNFTSKGVLFDFYRHRLAPLSGLRRLRGRLASSRSSQAPSASYIAS
jgi:hypothetical protein